MSVEENIKQELTDKFKYLQGNIKVQRVRRIYLEADYNNFAEVFDYAVRKLNFTHLSTITGLDEQEKLTLIYHLAQDSGVVLNLRTGVPKANPAIKTVMPYFPGAEIYERELVDLLGVKVEGLPAGHRYPLTDDWPQDEHPLCKDWKSSDSEEKGVDKNA